MKEQKKQRREKTYSVNRFAENKSATKKGEMKRVDLRDSEVDGHFLPGEGEDRHIEELFGIANVLGLLEQCRRQEDGFGECRMTRWRKSAEEGRIFRTKRVGVFLTYSVVCVKIEGVQVDMVTVRMIIKGLCG